MDDEEAGVFASFEEVLLGGEFKDIVGKLEGDRLHFLNDTLTRLFNMTEGVSLLALKVGHILFPLLLELLEDLWRNTQLTASSVHDGWQILLWLSDDIAVVEHTLTQ